MFKEDYCNIILYHYNKITKPLCDKVHEKNKSVWNFKIKNEADMIR